MSGYDVYQPTYANPNDGELITQCKILEKVSQNDTPLGRTGGSLVPVSSTATGNFCAIQFVTSGSLTAYTGSITGTVTGVAFPAGFILYGNHTSFTTGGSQIAVAYNA